MKPLVLPYEGTLPDVHPDAWLAPGAVVIGDVTIAADASVWYGSVLRGDIHRIRVGARTNLQDQCVVHVTRERFPTEIGCDVTVGHRATVHGCTVRDGALVGIGATVLDGAVIGEHALVAAGALVAPGVEIPPGVLARGIPARVARDLTPQEIADQLERALEYVETARRHRAAQAALLSAGREAGGT
ncbi:MAG: gamma carbonic anhydrase family protein [Myxococcales bacterium]|nr:gamma carbonic anhydrase family protein [Myxococcales bacterium]